MDASLILPPLDGTVSVDTDRDSEYTMASRSASSRFGKSSKNTFFWRNSPHPQRVTHFTDMVGRPVRMVHNDDDEKTAYLESARFNLTHHWPQSKVNMLSPRQSMPVTSINLFRKQLNPDEITARRNFTGLRNFSYKEKAIPRVGLVPITTNWREELRSITEAATQDMQAIKLDKEIVQKPETTRRRQIFSRQTGRLIPQSSKDLRSRKYTNKYDPLLDRGYKHISKESDYESDVFGMLCQILQTEDVSAVQGWLSSASHREKSMAVAIISSALINKDDYFTFTAATKADENVKTETENIIPSSTADVLTVHETKGNEEEMVDNKSQEKAKKPKYKSKYHRVGYTTNIHKLTQNKVPPKPQMKDSATSTKELWEPIKSLATLSHSGS